MRTNGQSQSLGTTLAQRPTPIPAARGGGRVRTYVQTPQPPARPQPAQQRVQPMVPDSPGTPLISFDPLGQASGNPYGGYTIMDALNSAQQADYRSGAVQGSPLIPLASVPGSVAQESFPAPQDDPIARALSYPVYQPNLRERPAAPKPLVVLPSPTRDMDAEKQASEDALRTGLIANALGSLFGTSGIYSGVNLSAALAGAREGADEGFARRVQQYELADRENREEAQRQQQGYENDVAGVDAANRLELQRAGLSEQEANRVLRAANYSATQSRSLAGMDQRAQHAYAQERNAYLLRLSQMTPAQQEQMLSGPNADAYADYYGIAARYDEQGRFIPYTRERDVIAQQNANTASRNANTSAQRAATSAKQGQERIDQAAQREKDLQQYRSQVLTQRSTALDLQRARVYKAATIKDPAARIFQLGKELKKTIVQRNNLARPSKAVLANEEYNPTLLENRREAINYYTSLAESTRAEIARLTAQRAAADLQSQSPTTTAPTGTSGTRTFKAKSGRTYGISDVQDGGFEDWRSRVRAHLSGK